MPHCIHSYPSLPLLCCWYDTGVDVVCLMCSRTSTSAWGWLVATVAAQNVFIPQQQVLTAVCSSAEQVHGGRESGVQS